jgi:DNA-binding NarL/FixJ family response regulator
MSGEPQSVLVVEDVQSTRDWLVQLTGNVFPQAQIATADTLATAMTWLAAQAADSAPICLVDLGLPDGSGIEFIRALMHRCAEARAVVTTLYDDDANLLNAMAAGAAGYILKDQEPELIGTKLSAMERGEVPMSPAISRRILKHFQNSSRFMTASQPDVSLTNRETDVLRLVGRGLKVAETADALQLSHQTVSGYLKTIYRKLDINCRAEAALEAARLGLV